MALRDYLVGEIAEDATDGLLTRREALRRLVLLGVSLPAATALLAACGDDDDDTTDDPASATTTEAVPPSTAEEISIGTLRAAYAEPADEATAAVLVIHENRGLTPHFADLLTRFADEGMAALCVDLVSAEGGTASMDEGAVQAALADAPLERLLNDLRAGLGELQTRAPRARLAVVGFCFGGAMTWNLLDAGDDRIAAAVAFYGPAPDAPDFTGLQAAVLGIYAGLDERVNRSRERVEAALTAAGIPHQLTTFDDVQHAFFNDTGERYDQAAAEEAWELTLNWIVDHT